MKNLATLKRLNSAIWQAENAYLKAVADNLKETGELRVKSEDYDEDLGYPEGILLSIPNRHFNLVDCVFDAIKVTDKGAIEVHICYFDDQEEEGWMQANELSFNDLDAIIDAIQWPDSITDGEAEKKRLMILCSYDEDEQEFDEHLIVSKEVFDSEKGKERIREYLEDAFELENMDEVDEEEFRECVASLLQGENGYYGIRYFWEEQDAIL